MLLYLFSDHKKFRLLEYPFIAKAAELHDNDRLESKSAGEFLDNLADFESQILKIILEREFDLLGKIGNNCKVPFDKIWEGDRFSNIQKPAFQTKKSDSIFSEYSSKGWKIHLAFVKGKEKDIAKFLFRHGLYFKVEMETGTYFYGNLQSGATIYIGSHNDMVRVVSLIEKKIRHFLEMGAYHSTDKGRIPSGSGSDIQIKQNIMARFDAQKSKWGSIGGSKKYFEHGLPTWTGMGGIPILTKYAKQVAEVTNENYWNRLIPGQREIYFNTFFKRVYEESRAELIKDFGREFIFGK